MKANEATRNRPEGNRVLDASYVIANLAERIAQLKEEDTWIKNDRNAITLVKNDRLTVVLICLQKGAVVDDNTIEGIVTLQVLDGRIEVETGAGSFEMEEKELIALQPNISHSLKAIRDTSLLLSNHIC